jgi:acid phosphatase family membrane protein YuiD
MFNRYVVVPLIVWAVAQFLKFTIAAFKGRIDFKYLYGSGGMPSVHSAVVTSLAVTSLLVDGPRSGIFGLTVIFAAIVMYDSFGVRRSSGEQAVAINAILDSMDRDRLDHPKIHLRELLGHKPLEVSVGAALGLVLGAILNADKLGPLVNIITLNVGKGMAIIVAALAVILLLAGLLARWAILRRYRKEVAAVRQATKTAAWSFWSLAIVGLLLGFIEYEHVAIAIWLIWPIVYAILILVVVFTLILKYRTSVPTAIIAYRVTADKDKWLEGPNKKRRAKKAARAKKRK